MAFLSNYTFNLICASLRRLLRKGGIESEFYVTGFNQYVQDIIGENTPLYDFGPDVVFVTIDLEQFCGDILGNIYTKGGELVWEGVFERWIALRSHIEMLQARLPEATIFFDNFFVPNHLLTGTLAYNGNYSLNEIVLKLNLELAEFQNEHKAVKVVDVQTLLASEGQSSLFDNRLYYISKCRWGHKGIEALAGLYLRYIKAYLGQRKKCILLDLDNTLWGGVIGQEGIEGISLSNDGPGKAFYNFQTELLKLHTMGLLLCICSKNTHEIAMEAIETHPYMVLRSEHFVATRINWENKAQNIMEIAEEINLGLDSFVFLDDSPFERALIKDQVPTVFVPELPEDPSDYASFLKGLDCFDFLELSLDDFNRNKDYRANVDRKKVMKSSVDIESYYRSLKMKAHIKMVDDFSLPRALQLTLKTNQFNVTTRRYTESDIRAFIRDGGYRLITLALEDKFGDSGIVGLAILKMSEMRAYIDSFILSCRVLGRTVEAAFLAYLAGLAKGSGAELLEGEIIPTKKKCAMQRPLPKTWV